MQWQETMYAKFRAHWVCMHRSPTSEYEEENLDDSGHLQRNVDAAILIYQDQADSVSTTASSASGLISLSPEDRISPQPGQYMDILSQAMALTGITMLLILMTCQSLHHVNLVQLFLNHLVYCDLLIKTEEWHWSSCGEEQARTRLPKCMVIKVKQLQQSQ